MLQTSVKCYKHLLNATSKLFHQSTGAQTYLQKFKTLTSHKIKLHILSPATTTNHQIFQPASTYRMSRVIYL